jgi:hypothetical protein
VRSANGTSLSFEAYGVVVSLDFVDAGLCREALSVLPAGARLIGDGPTHVRLAVDSQGRLSPTASPEPDSVTAARTGPRARLAAGLRHHVALHSSDLFVHAGVVAVNGSALLIPGRSHSGKSTLVAALLRMGAAYLSDEYAVIDQRGTILPFPTALSIRDGAGVARRVDPEALGASVITGPTPARLVVATRFRPGARWDPRPVSRGEAMLHLLQNTIAARSQSVKAMRRIRLACERADGLVGPRGEFEAAARDLMMRMRVPAPGR